MAEHADGLDAVFSALAHPLRRDILTRLGPGPLSVGELAAPMPVSLAAASKHVQVLERAGLIERTVVGRRHEFRLQRDPLASADAWLGEHAGQESSSRAGTVKTPEATKTSKATKTKKAKKSAKAKQPAKAKTTKTKKAKAKKAKRTH